MTEEQMKERKKMLCDLMDNDLYVPMKIKELAIFLIFPKKSGLICRKCWISSCWRERWKFPRRVNTVKAKESFW